MNSPISEQSARQIEKCVCGTIKGAGPLVCWRCFKRVPVPLKDFQGTFEEWQALQPQNEGGAK